MTAVDDFRVCGESNRGERASRSHVHREIIAESAAVLRHSCVSTCDSECAAVSARENSIRKSFKARRENLSNFPPKPKFNKFALVPS